MKAQKFFPKIQERTSRLKEKDTLVQLSGLQNIGANM